MTKGRAQEIKVKYVINLTIVLVEKRRFFDLFSYALTRKSKKMNLDEDAVVSSVLHDIMKSKNVLSDSMDLLHDT